MGLPRPEGLPEEKFQTGVDGLTSFEILIPWNIFPPANQLSLDHIQIRLDIVDSGSSVVASTNYIHVAGEEKLPVLAVSPPIVSRIGPCGQPLIGQNLNGDDVFGFYFLTASRQIDDIYIFDNPYGPYMPDLPEASDVSPIARSSHFFFQQLGPGEFLCGPFMSYRKGQVVKEFPFRLAPPPGQLSINRLTEFPVILTGFPVKRLADGTRLIRYGPDITVMPLSHKAAVTYSLRIFALTPALEVAEVLNIGAWSYFVPGYEIEISDDWRTVKEYSKKDDIWSVETFCLAGSSYRSCGKQVGAAAPKKRVFTQDQ